jgi:hypothetical protein
MVTMKMAPLLTFQKRFTNLKKNKKGIPSFSAYKSDSGVRLAHKKKWQCPMVVLIGLLPTIP